MKVLIQVNIDYYSQIFIYSQKFLFFFFFTQDKKGQVVSTDAFIKQVRVLETL